ncbi:MAG: DNA-processing protein DprA, partial [Pseudomonadales bacterium]
AYWLALLEDPLLGAEVAGAVAGELARRGAAIVSGLARGIDTAAHRAALCEGRTVAVLGSGLVRPYPAGNRGLMRAIVDSGGLLASEYPPLAHPRRHHFPERNRLISGLALGVVVVEAGEHSGSLITARMALEQGREVFAVPGPVTSPASRGCHRLLRDGAALVETADDVLDGLGLQTGLEIASPVVAGAEPQLVDAAPAGPGGRVPALLLAVLSGAAVATLDEIVSATGTSAETAAAALVELELGGFVRQVPGGYIRRPSRTL